MRRAVCSRAVEHKSRNGVCVVLKIKKGATGQVFQEGFIPRRETLGCLLGRRPRDRALSDSRWPKLDNAGRAEQEDEERAKTLVRAST
jgi:hypothetical protein